ncbi:MAG: carbonic anhydrase [Caldilineaceae bacterium]|nr:carbonic anhydrase [Caldilineaceae bacterium]
MQTTSTQALDRLLAGNRRFAAGETRYGQISRRARSELLAGQQPLAILFGCVDSRVSPTAIFDVDPGEVLIIRTAGQVLDDAVIASIEFGVDVLDIPLIVVLGHTHCGAVTAAAQPIDAAPLPGKLGGLIDAIRPAVEQARQADSRQTEEEVIARAIGLNVQLSMQNLLDSPVIAAAVAAERVSIVGVVYDLATGAVSEVGANEVTASERA